jgi:threonine synthase
VGEKKVKRDGSFVVVLTGQLLKDPESVNKFKVSTKQVEPEVEKIEPLVMA